MSVTLEGIGEIASSVINIIDKVNYKQNEILKAKNLKGISVNDGVINLIVVLDEDENGKFSDFQILSKSGKILIERPNIVEKKVGKMALTFKLKIQEV